MKAVIGTCLTLLLYMAPSHAAPKPDEIPAIEQALSEWLADPQEMGVAPKRVKYLSSATTTVPGGTQAEVHIVEYQMPDGTYGKGFVNPATFSFGPLPYDKLSNEQLVTAYTGMLVLVGGLENKSIVTEFQAKTAAQFTKELAAQGLKGVRLTDRYRIGGNELFSFEATKGPKRFKGAGQTGLAILFEAAAPEAAIPVIYTFLGKVQRGEFR